MRTHHPKEVAQTRVQRQDRAWCFRVRVTALPWWPRDRVGGTVPWHKKSWRTWLDKIRKQKSRTSVKSTSSPTAPKEDYPNSQRLPNQDPTPWTFHASGWRGYPLLLRSQSLPWKGNCFLVSGPTCHFTMAGVKWSRVWDEPGSEPGNCRK